MINFNTAQTLAGMLSVASANAVEHVNTITQAGFKQANDTSKHTNCETLKVNYMYMYMLFRIKVGTV